MTQAWSALGKEAGIMRSMAQGCEKPKPLSYTVKQTWSPSTWLLVNLATTSQGAEGVPKPRGEALLSA